MGDTTLACLDGVHVSIIDKIGMCKHGFVSEQSEIIQANRIPLAMSFDNITVLPVTFRTMGLYVACVFLGDLSQTLQHLVRATGYESWRYYR